MAKKLPKKVFIYWDGNDDETWLNVFETLEETVQPGDKQFVGVYELTKQGTVKSEVKLVSEL